MRTFIDGEFYGFDDGAIFRLSNGEVWQQARYRYHYHYAYQPEVIVSRGGGQCVIEVPCIGQSIEVVEVNVIKEGNIISDFAGFSFGAEFVFGNGQKWRQTQYFTRTRNLSRPGAMIIEGNDGKRLNVRGMSETVRVARVE